MGFAYKGDLNRETVLDQVSDYQCEIILLLLRDISTALDTVMYTVFLSMFQDMLVYQVKYFKNVILI